MQRGDATLSTPSGWTLLEETQSNTGAGDNRLYTFSKVAGGSEPADYTVTASGTAWLSGTILRLTGASVSSPIADSDENSAESATSLNTPSISTTVNNSMFVIFASRRDSGGDTPTASGYTNRANSAVSSIRIDAFTKAQASPGASGAVTVDYTNTQDDMCVHIIAVDKALETFDLDDDFTPTIDFEGDLQKYTHVVSGSFEVTADFIGDAKGDKDVVGTFEISADFVGEFSNDLAGVFNIAIDFVHTGSLRDYNIAGLFQLAAQMQGVGSISPHVLLGEFRLPLRFSDGYTGRGTGLIWTFPASVGTKQQGAYELNKFLAQLRVGDEFPGYFPLGGVEGKTGKVRVVARRYNDSLEVPDLDIQLIENQDPEIIGRLKEDSVIPFIPQKSGNLFRNVIELRRRKNTRG